MGRPLKIAKSQAVLTVTATSNAGVVTVSDNLTTAPTVGVTAGMPFVMATTTGGLTAGVTYYILAITGNHTFTVSSTQLSVQPQVSPTMSNAGPVSVKATVGLVDYSFSNPDGSNTATNSTTYGVVGGNTAQYGKQTLTRVAIGQTGTGTLVVESGNTTVVGTSTVFSTQLAAGSVLTTTDGTTIGFVDSITDDGELELASAATADYTDINFIFATNEAGFIVRQKGKTKYLVQGATSGLVGACYTANVANAALTPNTMNILATYTGPSTKYVSSLNDYQSEAFPAQVAAASLVAGTVYTIYSTGTTDFTAVGAASNMTGVTFTATGAGSGTGTAVLSTVNPDVIATFNTAYAANTYGGQPNPIVVISNA